MPIEPLIELLPSGLQPVEAFQRLSNFSNVLFLDGDAEQGEFSFISGDPFTHMEYQNGHLTTKGLWHPENPDPLNALRNAHSRFELKLIPQLPPFQGGLAGLFGYGMSQLLERLPPEPKAAFPTPDFSLGLYDWTIGYDLRTKQGYIFSTGFPETEENKRISRAKDRLMQVMQILKSPAQPIHGTPIPRHPPELKKPFWKDQVYTDLTMADYSQRVQSCVDYIHQGDCFQINFTQRFWQPAFCSDLDLYLHLRKECPAPYSGFFRTNHGCLLSVSPERFLYSNGNRVTTRPIKGTRKRSTDPQEDNALCMALLSSSKDRAENVMIVDLLRNDLGRCCKYGTIRVDDLCRLESFSNVHHLVSTVSGDLRPDRNNLDLLLACFPGGSVTGAPKIRAMQIISELEQSPRGIYCGTLGYLGFNGQMDTNILIRSIYSGNGWLQFGSGGGIVADSLPEGEYQEMLTKVSGILGALKNHPKNPLSH